MTLSINAFKTPSGLLKVGHVVFGVLCFVLASVYGIFPYVVIISGEGGGSITIPSDICIMKEYFAFLVLVFASLFTSFLLLVSYINEECAESLKKSMFEILFHLFSFLLYLSITIANIVNLARVPKEELKHVNIAPHAFVVIFGFMNSFLYALNAFFGFRTARQT